MKVVIIGGGYAGVACATRLMRKAKTASQPLQVTLINPGEWFVERIRLHQAASGQALRKRSLAKLLNRAGVEFVAGTVESIDPDNQTVKVAGRHLPWDRLVLAMGSEAGQPPAGFKADAFCLNPGDAHEIADRLGRLPAGAHVTVVGGGLTGIETVTEISESWPRLQPVLLTRGRLLDDWSPKAREHLLNHFRQQGIRLEEEADVQGYQDGLILTGRNSVPARLCIWTAGFSMPSLAGQCGLASHADGRLLVDPMLRSISNPAIYAAGDIARPLVDPGQSLPMGCKSALPMGAHVADNLAREHEELQPRGFDFALPFYCVSLGRADGLIQHPGDHGLPTGRVLTGKRAAWFKEFICRSTWWSLVLESRGKPGVMWMRTGDAPQQLPADMVEGLAS